ncbi:Uncharacterised protein [Vibrio cholerae]|nr:Uncharacterised protein [Vibrio cholerae]
MDMRVGIGNFDQKTGVGLEGLLHCAGIVCR